jgi:acyl carrier protein
MPVAPDRAAIEERIERYVREQFRVSETDGRFDRATDLYQNGYVDSVGVAELLAFITEEFGVDIPDEALSSDEFSTITGMAGIILDLRDDGLLGDAMAGG